MRSRTFGSSCVVNHPLPLLGGAPSFRPARSSAPVNLFSLGAVLQHERDRHVGLVAFDVAILNHDVHVLNPAPLDAPQGLGGAGYSLIDGVLETLLGDGAQLGDACDAHISVSPPKP